MSKPEISKAELARQTAQLTMNLDQVFPELKLFQSFKKFNNALAEGYDNRDDFFLSLTDFMVFFRMAEAMGTVASHMAKTTEDINTAVMINHLRKNLGTYAREYLHLQKLSETMPLRKHKPKMVLGYETTIKEPVFDTLHLPPLAPDQFYVIRNSQGTEVYTRDREAAYRYYKIPLSERPKPQDSKPVEPIKKVEEKKPFYNRRGHVEVPK